MSISKTHGSVAALNVVPELETFDPFPKVTKPGANIGFAGR